MNPEDIVQFLKLSFERFISDSPTTEKWDALRNELLNWIKRLPPEEAFAGLISTIESCDRYQIQWLAGDLLQRGAIPCRLPLNEWLDRVAGNLNASATTVVDYASLMYGHNALIAAVNTALERKDAVGNRKIGLETLRYFSRSFPS
jgi:hypothetical protein